MADPAAPERLVCDTSFISHLRALRVRPERYANWDPDALARVEQAVLAISVVTLAEARAGYRKAGWGDAKITEEERRLAGFLQIPLAYPDLDEWARLRDRARRQGIGITDNDLWIAATASTRRHPLVTCDRDQLRLEQDLSVPVIYFPPPP